MVRIKLAEHKYRQIDSMVKTTFWSPDGKPISAEQFIRELFGELPELFQSEDELRQIWSAPSTRKQLLQKLSDRGFSSSQLKELQTVVHGEDSDIFDVLKFVAYNSKMTLRAERANRFSSSALDSFSLQQQEFISFVVEQYVRSGASELDDAKLAALLQLKYQSVADAKTKLGDIPEIRDLFIGFQQQFYTAG